MGVEPCVDCFRVRGASLGLEKTLRFSLKEMTKIRAWNQGFRCPAVVAGTHCGQQRAECTRSARCLCARFGASRLCTPSLTRSLSSRSDALGPRYREKAVQAQASAQPQAQGLRFLTLGKDKRTKGGRRKLYMHIPMLPDTDTQRRREIHRTQSHKHKNPWATQNNSGARGWGGANRNTKVTRRHTYREKSTRHATGAQAHTKA